MPIAGRPGVRQGSTSPGDVSAGSSLVEQVQLALSAVVVLLLLSSTPASIRERPQAAFCSPICPKNDLLVAILVE